MAAPQFGDVRSQQLHRKQNAMSEHTGRIPGADHVPGAKGLEEEIREANKDDPTLSQEPPDADEVEESELTDDARERGA